jgi:hypothetical protein
MSRFWSRWISWGKSADFKSPRERRTGQKPNCRTSLFGLSPPPARRASAVISKTEEVFHFFLPDCGTGVIGFSHCYWSPTPERSFLLGRPGSGFRRFLNVRI